ncbi:type VI secretion system-associated protein TagO [Methylobacterium sp. E-045]|uniref:type VI secretion system-associated protein TagO n=1 Tax=Methylobacterium sp. E-045 TaxID=2836575 RepID=UPI00391D26B4
MLSSDKSVAQATDCPSLKDDKARLECYDGKAKPSASPNTGEWYKQETVSDLDRSKTVTIAINSLRSSIYKDGSKPQFARLVISCREKKTTLYVDFRSAIGYIDRTFSAQYRVGDNKPVSAKWSISQDHNAFGPFESPSTVPLVKALMQADDFYVRGDDAVGGTSDALFKVEGLSEAVKPLRAGCNW